MNEVLSALQILDEKDLQVQSGGLFTNTFHTDLVPDATTGKIDVNPLTIFITAWAKDIRRNVTMLPDGDIQRLFDLDNETFDWSDQTCVSVRSFVRADFEGDLTAAQQFYITHEAAREYQMATVGSDRVDRHLAQVAARARAFARREDVMARKANMFNTSRSNLARSQARGVFRPWLPESPGTTTLNHRDI